MLKPIVASLLLALVCARVAGAAPRACETLADLRLPGTTITSATATAGTWTSPSGAPLEGLPAFCRVVGVIRPTSDSHIEFEVWLPSAGWNGKFQGIGNGGFAGTIAYDMLANAVRRGYAAAATDTGHKGGATDARWALGHPEKIVDFGHRAIHEMTVKAKSVIAAFYGEAPRRAYFAACSNGGRQALIEAQRYPDDYDGIVAGAPAAAWTRFMLSFTWNVQALGEPTTHIPPSRLPTIQKAVVAACDARDRVPDGVIAAPQSCAFDPRTLTCTSADAGECLTAPQVEALAKVYAGPRTRGGAVIARGFPPGAETGLGGWAPWITGSAPRESLQAAFAMGTLRHMVFDRADYDIRAFDFDRDATVVDQRIGRTLNATDPDLSAFHRRGGKLILFHGWNDPALSAHETVDYFQAMRSRMGSATDTFARLYMIPGLQHCQGGPGATYTGGHTVPFGDAEHDLSAALERWVETSVAPGAIVATQMPNRARLGDPLPPGPRRLICPHPQVAEFSGTGSPDDPAGWACTRP
jgi:feruloyl esterase